MEYYKFYHKKLNFSAQKSRKTRDFEKKCMRNIAEIVLTPELLGFSVSRPKSLGIDVK